MKPLFVVVVLVMVVIAIAVIVWPLLRADSRKPHSRRVFALALAVILAIPLATTALYLHVGSPTTLNGVALQPAPMNINQALSDLRAHLKQQPDDLRGWALLAQTTAAMHLPAEARDAYDHMLKIDASNTDAMVGWAEADSMLQSTHVISDWARDLLRQAVQKEPDNQRALWLLGISQFQQNEFSQAAATWRHLQPLLQPGSSVATAVAAQIAVADARVGDSASSAQAAKASAAGPELQVTVTISPAMKSKVGKGDTLFIYARAPNGPPMPLAVARMDAGALPASVTLTDAMAMTPQLKLSSVTQVFVGARISHDGQAIARPGDLEGNAGVVPVDTKKPIDIIIGTVH